MLSLLQLLTGGVENRVTLTSRLRLRRCRRITDVSVSYISRLTTLKELTLNRSPLLSGSCLSSLSSLRCLISLDVSGLTGVQSVHLSALSCLTALENLAVEEAAGMDDNAVLAIVPQLPSLHSLDLGRYNCPVVTSAAVPRILFGSGW